MSVQTVEPKIHTFPFLCRIDSSTMAETKTKPQSTLTERAILHLARGSAKSSDKEREEMDLG